MIPIERYMFNVNIDIIVCFQLQVAFENGLLNNDRLNRVVDRERRQINDKVFCVLDNIKCSF